jgi:hypothetical protein
MVDIRQCGTEEGDIPSIFHPITIFMDKDLRSEQSMAAA